MGEIKEESHVIENKWALSEQYDIENKSNRGEGYQNSFEKVCIFNTLEGFWSYWSKLPAVSDYFYNGTERLVERSDLRAPNEQPKKHRVVGQCLFKDGIEPKFEDPQNSKGGHLQLVFLVEDQDKLGVFWESLVLSLIGETIDDENNITGARVFDKSNAMKKQINHRIQVWFRDWENEDFKTKLLKDVSYLLEDCDMHPKEINFHTNDCSKWTK